MRQARFHSAACLATALGETPLLTGEDLRTTLRLGGPISLWDVVVTYLSLYRFPLLFDDDGKAASLPLSVSFRPYRGLAVRLRDRLFAPPPVTANCLRSADARPLIVFVAMNWAFYRDVLRPVAELLSGGDARVVVVHEPDIPDPAQSGSEIAFRSIWSHRDSDAMVLERCLFDGLAQAQATALSRAQLNDLRAQVRERVGDVDPAPELKWLFWRELVRLIPRVAAAHRLLSHDTPALIVSADDADQRSRIFSLLGGALGIPSLMVEQGLSQSDVPEWRFMSHGNIAAMGSSSRDDMIAQGVPAENIVVTGHPGFDRLAANGIDDAFRRQLRIDKHQTMVLFASQPTLVGAFQSAARRVEMIEALVRAANTSDRIKLIVKPHPSDHIGELRALVRGHANASIVDAGLDISPLISACDIFVTFFSTTGLQALYAQKPVITLDVAGGAGSRMYAESGATWTARTPAELDAILAALISGSADDAEEKAEARERFLGDLVYRTDGRSAHRVADVASRLIDRRSPVCA